MILEYLISDRRKTRLYEHARRIKIYDAAKLARYWQIQRKTSGMPLSRDAWSIRERPTMRLLRIHRYYATVNSEDRADCPHTLSSYVS